MPRYERGADWFAIEVDDVCLVIEDGGGRRVETFESSDEAEAGYDERVFAALEGGYRLVTGDQESTALERSIIERPDDHDAHLVYADLLMTEGDPRGELIAVSVEIEKSPDDRALRRRAKAILEDHADVLLGDLEDLIDLGLEVHWRLGFIDRAEIAFPFDADEDASDEPSVLSTLLAHPSARFLRDLHVQRARDPVNDLMLDPLADAIVRHAAPSLSTLWLRAGREAILDNAEVLFNALSELRTLRLRVEHVGVTGIETPSLETLVIEDFLSAPLARAIAAARWPRLAKLELSLQQVGTPAEVISVFSRPDHFPALKSLHLPGAWIADQLVLPLLRAPILEQLEILDLSEGRLSDAAVEDLLSNREALVRLKRLDLSRNDLSDEAISALRQLPCEVWYGSRMRLQFDDGEADEDHYDEIME